MPSTAPAAPPGPPTREGRLSDARQLQFEYPPSMGSDPTVEEPRVGGLSIFSPAGSSLDWPVQAPTPSPDQGAPPYKADLIDLGTDAAAARPPPSTPVPVPVPLGAQAEPPTDLLSAPGPVDVVGVEINQQQNTGSRRGPN